ncbi:DUF3263 domain-containing protein [Streptomyces sp. ID03-2B]|uniref:DUF3263 domain-containing protein n=1 Tax=Streptomyces sp. ID03-2B TaxID=3028660 RepID=UPI0029A2574F|nr:DUF3263 domain-containing protein [Streptomyces sp. ID03-2B]MDX3595507.1 DUF3263 domain-containing protein [Streptomyces sp. ID03-2B]
MTASGPAPDPDPGPAPAGSEQPDSPAVDSPAGESSAVPVPVAGADELSVRERALLALERRSWAGPGAKERAIREELGMSPVRYFQLLNALIEDERALRVDPVTVNRLRRVRDARRGRR